MIRTAPLVMCLLFAGLLGAASPAAANEEAWDRTCRRFALFDVDGDGIVEIRGMRYLYGAGESGRGLLVLIEPRLLEPVDDAPLLLGRLKRLADDLSREGYHPALLAVDLEPGETHRDGRLVLALREVLRAVRSEGALAGALLVGRFPDALLVRTCNWRKRGKVRVRNGEPDEATYDDVPYLRRVPEAVAHRADIVLCDLDGRWEDVYVQPRSRLSTTWAVYPSGVPERGGPCADLERGSVTYEDFFHVSDGKLEVREQVDAEGTLTGYALALFDESADHEVGKEDRTRPNAMARPDIVVSRIDARGVALRPRRDVTGVDGRGLLDERGRPQAVRFASRAAVPHWRDEIWEQDPVLERRLLAEYLDRNHAYRTGLAEVAWRPASIAHGLGSGYGVMRRAATDWIEDDAAVADVRGRPTLLDLVRWLGHPAVLRTIRAHSDPWGSRFERGELDALLDHFGEPVPAWTPEGDRLVPSLKAACRGGKLDWFLLHALWAKGDVAPGPAFYHHMGCESISPPNYAARPFHHASYGRRQGAESLLFFANGLALVGRAKVFYDEPRGFAETLAEGQAFGAAWANYFEVESQAPTWGQAGGDIGRKRAYFWSVLGDWTLRLHARPRDER